MRSGIRQVYPKMKMKKGVGLFSTRTEKKVIFFYTLAKRCRLWRVALEAVRRHTGDGCECKAVHKWVTPSHDFCLHIV